MPRYCYSEVSDRLVEALPELRDRYDWLRGDWGGEAPGPYIVFGDLLQHYCIVQLELGAPPEELKRIFALAEELASHPDEQVQTLVQLEICEPIFDAHLLGTAWNLMGKSTRRLCLNFLMWQPSPGTFKEDQHSAQDVAGYNAAWRAELESVGPLTEVPLPDVFEIRKRLVARYGLHYYPFYESYENWDLYTVVRRSEYCRRFKEELEQLGEPEDLYEWIAGLRDIRDRLFDTLRPHDAQGGDC